MVSLYLLPGGRNQHESKAYLTSDPLSFFTSPPLSRVPQDCLKLTTWLGSVDSSAGIELLTILFLRGAGISCVCHCAHLLAQGSVLRRFRLPAARQPQCAESSYPLVRHFHLRLCYGACSVVCVLPSCLASTELQHPKHVFFLFLA